jgi:hypothetical protein
MSFIAITYGYNQYSIFNTCVPTQPLIDSIATTCLTEINTSVEVKKVTLGKEISRLESDTTSTKKEVLNLEKEKQKEEERIMEMSKQMESPKKGAAKGAIKKQPFTSELLTRKIEEIKIANARLCDLVSTKDKLVSKVTALDVLFQKFSKIGKTSFLNL